MLYLGRERDHRPPNILQQPPSKIFFRTGQKVTLLCKADGNPKPKYRWTRNGEQYFFSTTRGRVTQVEGEGTLVFSNTQYYDEGIYQCEAINRFGISFSDKADMRKAKLGTFYNEPKRTHTVEVGAQLTLPCSPPVSVPSAEITWVLLDADYRSTPLNLDDRVSVDIEGRLHIAHVKKSDEQNGRSYSCSAENKVVLMRVHGSEHIIQVFGNKTQSHPVEELYTSPADQIFLKGDLLRLQCIFAGNPTPKVEWKRPHGILPDDAHVENFGKELRIENVQVSDAGKYTCTGRNSLGTPISKEFNVKVESAPFWVEEPTDVEASIDKKATFSCKADGDPKPEHTWYISGVALKDSGTGVVDASIYNDKRFSMPDPYTITLSKLTLDDQMNIQCNASNKHGYVFSDVYLYVRTNILNTVTIDVKPKDVEVVKGDNVTFICSVNNDEKIDTDVNWDRGGKHVQTDDYRVILDTNSMSIFGTTVKDTGVYTCVVKTDSDEVRADGSLKVIDSPSPPEQVEILSCLAKSAQIKWMNANDNNAPIQHLHIQYNTSFHPEVWTTAITVKNTDTASVSLSPYANYTFRVIATNKVGDSLPSLQTPVMCSTPPDRPYTNPRNVTSIRDTKGFLEIKWNTMEEEEHNGPHFDYRIHLKQRDMSPDVSNQYIINDWRTNFLQVPVESSYTPYLVRVQARNALGDALEEPAEYTVYTYEDIPKVRPFEVKVTSKGNTVAEVEWKWDSNWLDEQSEISDIQGQFKGFKIRHWCTGSKSYTLEEIDVPFEDVIPNMNHKDRQIQSTYILTNLNRCNNIQVEVAVRNNFYVGMPSDKVLFYVDREKDTRPPNILEQPRSNVVFFRPGQQVKLACKAEGYPKPEYKWTRNGDSYSPDFAGGKVTQFEGEGTLVFNYIRSYDEGIYQCQAENGIGVSVTDKITLRRAKIGYFHSQPTRTYTVEEGDHLTLPCVPPISVPSAKISWTGVDTNDRVSIDIEGNLRFANVKKSDGQYGRSYSCTVMNHVLRMMVQGPNHVVRVHGDKVQNHPVEELYTSPRDQFFLKGERLRLQCIFAGNPTPRVIWYKLNGTLPSRAWINSGGQELQISDLRESDAGQYECTADSGTISKTFDVRIESAPYWVEELKNVVAGLSEEARFVCKADGDPKPKYTWYINGRSQDSLYETGFRDQRFRLKDPSTIIVSNLRLDDQMNIQCNASNKHGYVFSDAYLDILENVVLYYPTQQPPSSPPPPTTTAGEITSPPSSREDKSDPITTPSKEPRERDTHSQENSSSEESTTDRGGEIIAGQSYDVPDQDS